MNTAVLNNTGDTVKLFDNSVKMVDSYTYSSSDYCNLEPTPGEENPFSASGSCGDVPPNKSYARIPDGIGGWVDPIPTPGFKNSLETAAILAPMVISASASSADVLESEPEPELMPELVEITEETIIATTTEAIILEEIIEEIATTTEETPVCGMTEEDTPVITEEITNEEIIAPIEEEVEETLLEILVEEPVIIEEILILPEGDGQPEPESENNI